MKKFYTLITVSAFVLLFVACNTSTISENSTKTNGQFPDAKIPANLNVKKGQTPASGFITSETAKQALSVRGISIPNYIKSRILQNQETSGLENGTNNNQQIQTNKKLKTQLQIKAAFEIPGIYIPKYIRSEITTNNKNK